MPTYPTTVALTQPDPSIDHPDPTLTSSQTGNNSELLDGQIGELDVLAALRAYIQKSSQLAGTGSDPDLLLQHERLPQRRRRASRRKMLTLSEDDLTHVASVSTDEYSHGFRSPGLTDKGRRQRVGGGREEEGLQPEGQTDRVEEEVHGQKEVEVDLPQVYPMSALLDQVRSPLCLSNIVINFFFCFFFLRL